MLCLKLTSPSTPDSRTNGILMMLTIIRKWTESKVKLEDTLLASGIMKIGKTIKLFLKIHHLKTIMKQVRFYKFNYDLLVNK
jgi:precorrin-4 methylase